MSAVAEPAVLLPTALGAAVERAVDRQMWCLGRDVRHPAGNLLVGLGFARIPSLGRASEYRRRVGGCTVRLWGFAAVLVPPHGSALVVRRLDPGPRVLPRTLALGEGLTRDVLGDLAIPAGSADRAMVARWLPFALRLMARYERAITATAGPGWRVRTQRTWARGQDEVVDTGAEWRLLARATRSALGAPA